MLLNLISFIVLAGGALVSLWLASLTWRARSRPVHLVGTLIFALGVVGFVVAIVIALFGFARLTFARGHPLSNVKVAATPQQIARGQQLAHQCVTCHSSTGSLPLDGSNTNVIKFPPIGTLRSPNLTPAGPLQSWTDAEIIRAIREGVSKSGHPLLGMPAWSYRYLSDNDVQALVAYLRSQPAVSHDVPARNLNILAALAVGVGLAPTSEEPAPSGPIVAPQAGTSAAYGRYLVAITGCRDCHGQDLNEGKAPLGIRALSPTPLGPSCWRLRSWTKPASLARCAQASRLAGAPSSPPRCRGRISRPLSATTI
jgi:mono/diheme cytochrome c family protein